MVAGAVVAAAMMLLRQTLNELLSENSSVGASSWLVELALFPFGFSAGFLLSSWSGPRYWLPVFFFVAMALNALLYGLLGALALYGARRFRAAPYVTLILVLSYWLFIFEFA